MTNERRATALVLSLFILAAPAVVYAQSSIDHFLCYKTRFRESQTVSLSDTFDSGSHEVGRGRFLCAPADKNGEGVLDTDTHLSGYRITGPHEAATDVELINQFGAFRYDTGRGKMTLLVPTAKSLDGPAGEPDPASNVDHYRCVSARTTLGTQELANRTAVNVVDQFGDRQVQLLRTSRARVCVPTDKNGEGIKSPDDHLVCYRTKAVPRSAGVTAEINNQFAAYVVKLGKAAQFCLPALPSCVSTAADDTTCDGLDDDCDGEFDEDYVSAPTSCGVGACASTGSTSCVNGAVVDSCTAGTPAADDETCNGIDDDCSGETDEDYVTTPTICGIGGCAAAGSLLCVGGSEEDACVAGTPANDDTTCDGVDDDCSGVADEDYVSAPTNCGVGACASSGSTSCVGGAVEDSCTAGEPAASDTTCNGVDDDCNGVADEDYVSTPTNCGVGACASTGSTSCVNGSVANSCAAGTPAASDTTCNGVDDDCNGVVDEDYVSTPTNCGVGACASTGSTSCVNGSVADSCTAGTPAASDTTCNGVDDDCNGVVDEDYASVPTNCGVGVCASNGATSCINGSVADSCSPGEPVPEVCGDGLDNDCNGEADDGCGGGEAVCPCKDQFGEGGTQYSDSFTALSCAGIPGTSLFLSDDPEAPETSREIFVDSGKSGGSCGWIEPIFSTQTLPATPEERDDCEALLRQIATNDGISCP